MKPADAAARKLLRWYPRVWRERYGEEFLAMVEDGLDGRRPTLRLRLSVARAGLRERAHQVRLAGQRTAVRAGRGLGGMPGLAMAFLVASIVASLALLVAVFALLGVIIISRTKGAAGPGRHVRGSSGRVR